MAAASSPSSTHQDAVQQDVTTDANSDTSASAGQGSNSEDSVKSEPDSIIYQVEPFVTYQHRIRTLARAVLWKNVREQDLDVERLDNGSYNRVMGITHKDNSANGRLEYDVRILWNHERENLEKDIAPLLFVKEYT